nr:MAG TPA: hypothetical protein [Caudoviricetes sp.]
MLIVILLGLKISHMLSPFKSDHRSLLQYPYK